MKPVLASRTTVLTKFAATRSEMSAAKEHLLLVGPPGCAKSLLLDSLMKWTNGTKFAILLTKYTVPEEVVGPVSLAGLKDDRYLRITAGKTSRSRLRLLRRGLQGVERHPEHAAANPERKNL
jgi:MoxR-like ATPase